MEIPVFHNFDHRNPVGMGIVTREWTVLGSGNRNPISADFHTVVLSYGQLTKP